MVGPLTLIYAPVSHLGHAETLALRMRLAGQRAQVRDVAGLTAALAEPCDAVMALGGCEEAVAVAYPDRQVQIPAPDAISDPKPKPARKPTR